LDAVIAETFGKLYGLPCWHVKPGLFPSLTLEFGQPHLECREPQPSKSTSRRVRELMARRSIHIHGDWHLWVRICHWSISVRRKQVGDSSTTRRIQRGARALDGQALVAMEVRRRGCRTFFRFDLGAVLVTWPWGRRSEQWMLFTPSGKVLTLRSDKMYSFVQDDGSEGERWHPLA
jgi:hypothetical protein